MREQSVHIAEEQLSAVLMRRCPQPGCNTPILKEDTSRSCNKMRCTVCEKDMCYCCRKDVTMEGYRHFNMQSDGTGKGEESAKCPLWEDTMERHKRDIEGAKWAMGDVAPATTVAESQDEARRRRQFERQAVDPYALYELEHILDEPNDEPDVFEHNRHRHDAIMEARSREARENEEAIDEQERREEAVRVELLTLRESRLQALGFSPAAPAMATREAPRQRYMHGTFASSARRHAHAATVASGSLRPQALGPRPAMQASAPRRTELPLPDPSRVTASSPPRISASVSTSTTLHPPRAPVSLPPKPAVLSVPRSPALHPPRAPVSLPPRPPERPVAMALITQLLPSGPAPSRAPKPTPPHTVPSKPQGRPALATPMASGAALTPAPTPLPPSTMPAEPASTNSRPVGSPSRRRHRPSSGLIRAANRAPARPGPGHGPSPTQ